MSGYDTFRSKRIKSWRKNEREKKETRERFRRYAGKPKVVKKYYNSDYILTCPVNTVGIMGKGLARAFKVRFPGYFTSYKNDCEQKKIYMDWRRQECRMTIYRDKETGVFIASMPTKEHWKFPSNYVIMDIAARAYVELANATLPDKRILMPKVGCGGGGLLWDDVYRTLRPVFNEYQGTVIYQNFDVS